MSTVRTVNPKAPSAETLEGAFCLPGDAVAAARALLGAHLVRIDENGTRLIGRIVETEAYTEDDPASHSFGGPKNRNLPMFAAAGTAYVYRSYGIHFCINVVTGPAGRGEAVLLRALEPVAGLEAMARRRGMEAPTALCSGPGKICQALAVDLSLNGADLLDPNGRLYLTEGTRPLPGSIIETTRIGITRAVELPRRFLLADSPHVSRRVRVSPVDRVGR